MTRDDLLIVIGRFAPFHNGHKHFIQEASKNYTNVLILLGSADRAPDLLVPWTIKERIDMMRFDFPNILAFEGIRDYPYPYRNGKWIKQVHDIAKPYIGRKTKVGIACNSVDGSTPYVHFFPDWKLESVETRNPINATTVREVLFNHTLAGSTLTNEIQDMVLRNFLPNNSYLHVREFQTTQWYYELRKVYHKMLENRATFGSGPFMCTDSLVTCKKHVLLVTRGPNRAGAGLLAIPGGYLEKNITLRQNASKELQEETSLLVDPDSWKGPIVFDAVNRSSTSRNLTAVFRHHIKGSKLPPVKGGDDAAKADWYPIKEVLEMGEYYKVEGTGLFHDDHFHIMENLLG